MALGGGSGLEGWFLPGHLGGGFCLGFVRQGGLTRLASREFTGRRYLNAQLSGGSISADLAVSAPPEPGVRMAQP